MYAYLCIARYAWGPPRRAVLYAFVLGDSNNTVRGYCLHIPRFEESLNNKHTAHKYKIRGTAYRIRRMG